MTGPTVTAASAGSPIFNASIAATSASRNGAGSPTTMTRLVAVHFCPANPATAPAIWAAARAGSASGSTMAGFWPPISACTATPRPAAAPTTDRPAATEPVNDTRSTLSTTAFPVAASPGRTANRASGSTGSSSSANRRAHAVASGAGLSTTALPKAKAGAAFQIGMASGKFHGVTSPATPRGRRVVNERPAPDDGSCTAPIGSNACWA